MGFQRFKQLNYNSYNQWNEFATKDEFYFKMSQMLSSLPLAAQKVTQPSLRPTFNGRQQYNGKPRTAPNRQMPIFSQQPMMQPQPSMPPPQMQPSLVVQPPSLEEQRFYQQTTKLVPSVKTENPHMKQSVGNAIFDFVQQLKGREFAPKITGMLIDLNLEEI